MASKRGVVAGQAGAVNERAAHNLPVAGSSPARPTCATLAAAAAGRCRSGGPEKRSSARWPTPARSLIRLPGTGPPPLSCWAVTACGWSTRSVTLSGPEPARQAPSPGCTCACTRPNATRVAGVQAGRTVAAHRAASGRTPVRRSLSARRHACRMRRETSARTASRMPRCANRLAAGANPSPAGRPGMTVLALSLSDQVDRAGRAAGESATAY